MTHAIFETVRQPSFGEILDEFGGGATLIASGFSSDVYRTIDPDGSQGDQVLKLTRFAGTAEESRRLTNVFIGEHDRTSHYLSGNIPEYTVVRPVRDDETGLSRVVTIQPAVEGQPLSEALANPDMDRKQAVDFLARALRMYKETGVMPDIGCVEKAFRFSLTPNVLVNPATSHLTLVDTMRGKTQRAPGIGRVWSGMIATGAYLASIKLGLSSNSQ